MVGGLAAAAVCAGGGSGGALYLAGSWPLGLIICFHCCLLVGVVAGVWWVSGGLYGWPWPLPWPLRRNLWATAGPKVPSGGLRGPHPVHPPHDAALPRGQRWEGPGNAARHSRVCTLRYIHGNEEREAKAPLVVVSWFCSVEHAYRVCVCARSRVCLLYPVVTLFQNNNPSPSSSPNVFSKSHS